jgi:integrase
MARTQRIALAGQPDTYTVLGADHLPIAAAEEHLQFLRDDTASPNTVKAYAAGLAAWWTLLEYTGTDWREISTAMFGQFLAYLRTGDLPGTARIGAPPTWRGPASTQLRAAAVLACYRYHADAHGLAGPYQRLFTSRGARGRSRYIPMLAGVAPPRPKDRPVYRVRRGNLAATPVLLPAQVSAILDGCATQDGDVWSGPASGFRDRLLIATLTGTGMGLGEALSLRPHDDHLGTGATSYIEVAGRQDHPRGARGKSLRGRRIYIGDTDVTHLDELRRQLAATQTLIGQRRDQYRKRSGRELGEDNIWIIERRREIASLQAILPRLTTAEDAGSIAGAGTAKRLPLLQIQTRGAHQSTLDKARRPATEQP